MKKSTKKVKKVVKKAVKKAPSRTKKTSTPVEEKPAGYCDIVGTTVTSVLATPMSILPNSRVMACNKCEDNVLVSPDSLNVSQEYVLKNWQKRFWCLKCAVAEQTKQLAERSSKMAAKG